MLLWPTGIPSSAMHYTVLQIIWISIWMVIPFRACGETQGTNPSILLLSIICSSIEHIFCVQQQDSDFLSNGNSIPSREHYLFHRINHGSLVGLQSSRGKVNILCISIRVCLIVDHPDYSSGDLCYYWITLLVENWNKVLIGSVLVCFRGFPDSSLCRSNVSSILDHSSRGQDDRTMVSCYLHECKHLKLLCKLSWDWGWLHGYLKF